ncbi:LysR family transcriptional regulator [Alicyclobacillus sp. ALC3]|uniref:LysR family transcriptional regulator n=1 Tax=Alicyclobacillus sp. ALC3 TaxID=2796143 RepID=UPI002378AD93|nr:LysR family transcriptional regulator [Alicyclobacillus sp. ALC3]WDL97689.1 LysR family transcriptional regulator [Alicyclobacillus sp. ALC3]
MHIEQLEYVIEVLKTRSFSVAAENLHISQSGVSKAIANLEEELDVKLFNRSRLGTVPTTEGKMVIKKIYEAMGKLAEIKEEAQRQTPLESGELRISAIPSMFMSVLIKAISSYKNDYPRVNVEITEQGVQDIIKDVNDEKIDVGLVSTFEDGWSGDDEVIFERLLRGEMNVCVNPHSPLALYESIAPEDVVKQPVVIFNGNNMRRFLADFVYKYGPMNVLFTSNNTDVIKRAVAEGLAITFMVDLGLQDDYYVSNGEIVPIPLVNHNLTNITFGSIRSRKRAMSNATREFLTYVRRHAASYNA